MVIKEEADLYLGLTSHMHAATKYRLYGISQSLVLENTQIPFSMGVRSDWPLLVSILNKGLASIGSGGLSKIVAEWIQRAEREMITDLAPEERAWLAQNHTVRVRVTNFAPHIFLEGDEAKGISVDYLKLITERTGVNFVFVEGKGGFWGAVESMKRAEGPDLIMGMESNPQQAGEISFSQPYMRAPQVIITRKDSDFVGRMQDLSGKTLAALRSGPGERIAEIYGDIEMAWLPSDRAALEAVSKGQANAYMGDLLVATYVIQTFGYSNLKVAAPGPLGDRLLCFANRADWPELTRVINKTLDSISRAERSAIQGKYLSLRYEYGIRPGDVVKRVLIVVGVALAIVLAFLVWNRTLNRRVRERTAEVVEREERFRATFEQAAVGIAHVSPDGRFLRINQRFCDITGYTHRETREITFPDITHPDDLDADL